MEFEYYVSLISFFSTVVGPDYELVLFDYRDEKPKALSIENGSLSGRNKNDGIPSFITKAIEEKVYLKSDYVFNKKTKAPNGKVLRSSIYFIKDVDDLKGVIMVNFDDMRYAMMARQIFELGHPDEYVEQEISISIKENSDIENTLDSNSFKDLVLSIINQQIDSFKIPIERLTQEEKIELIGRLDDKGIFMMKGSVDILVDKLDSSPASIYRYLNESRKGE